jgi:succinate dehydrogenase / fumarate reductase iron-sulfur subunit
MNITVRAWRQPSAAAAGRFVDYGLRDLTPDASFLEMLDILNEQLVMKGEDPIAFDHDCREGICGSCGLVIDGIPHGPESGAATCQLYMRKFRDGDTITIEPWRARAFPIVKDLVVDRSAFDRIIAAGGYCSVDVGGAPDANGILIGGSVAEQAMDTASCIGCGACVAACKNASAVLFVGAKITQLALLPQGEPERKRRAWSMLERMEAEGFGGCSNEGECEAVCPKQISTLSISKFIREVSRSAFCP